MTIDRIDRSEDGSRWAISMSKGGERESESFDKVLVCTGPYNRPHIPSIPGVDSFGGKVSHARVYKGYVSHPCGSAKGDSLGRRSMRERG